MQKTDVVIIQSIKENMRYFKRLLFTAFLFLASNGGEAQDRQNPENYNSIYSEHFTQQEITEQTKKTRAASIQALRDKIAQHPLVSNETLPQVDIHFGVPTFLVAPDTLPTVKVGRLSQNMGNKSEFAAKEYVRQYASLYKLNKKTLSGAAVKNIHDTGKGAVIVKFNQEVDGIEVFGREMNVMMNRDSKLKAISGFLSPHPGKPYNLPTTFALSDRKAITIAFQDLGGELKESELVLDAVKSGYTFYLPENQQNKEYILQERTRAKKVFFNLQDRLVPAYYVEVIGSAADRLHDLDYYSYVVSAENGEILFRNNLSAHATNSTNTAYTYKVYADEKGFPYDSPRGNSGTPYLKMDSSYPPLATQQEVTLEHHSSISTKDPWLPADATETSGNNVFAYRTGGHHAPTSSPYNFGYIHQPTTRQEDQLEHQNAAITNLFYVNNFLHDWFYDAGFNEESGNAQWNNYGRGGSDGDPLGVVLNDYDRGTNNATMYTPADGLSPRMNLYYFTAKDKKLTFYNDDGTINSILMSQRSEVANPNDSSFVVNKELIRAYDQFGNTGGCEPIDNNRNDVTGKIALIDIGFCDYSIQAANAKEAGAVAVIGIIKWSPQPDQLLPLSDDSKPVEIPFMAVSQFTGKLIEQEMANGTIRAKMERNTGSTWGTLNGAFENSIIAHEWGHYISNRLIGNGNGLTPPQSGSLGEGWADFHSLLLMVREEDRQIPGNEHFQAPYAVGSYVLVEWIRSAYYFGIRRYPYSTDKRINPLTFKHIKKGVPLPDSPFRNQNSGKNSEYHNAGEIWALALWEVYAALLNSDRLSFDQMREQMKIYLVESYKMTPIDPTYTIARDAMLQVIKNHNDADYQLARKAFAKRGLGISAVSPPLYTWDNEGTIESFDNADSSLRFLEASINKSGGACDTDDTIDFGESFNISVTLQNSGITRLEDTTATISIDPSSDSGIEISFGEDKNEEGTIRFSSSNAKETITGSVTAKLTKASRKGRLVLKITYSDSAIKNGELTVAPEKLVEFVHFDMSEANRTVDDGESPRSDWKIVRDFLKPEDTWFIHQDLAQLPTTNLDDISENETKELRKLKHGFYASIPSSYSEKILESPEAIVDEKGIFTVTFKHLYHFQSPMASADLYNIFDGGILEVSLDGADWQDITEVGKIAPGYDGKFVGRGNALTPNSDENKDSFGWGYKNPDFPALTKATATIKGIPYTKVRIRFRVASDWTIGGFGWYVDDIEFSGIMNAPFRSVVNDIGDCFNQTPLVNAGADRTERISSVITLEGSATDGDGDPMTYLWVQTAGPKAKMKNTDQKTVEIELPHTTHDSILIFAFTANDGKVTSKPDYVIINLLSVNRAPTEPFLIFPEHGAKQIESDISFKWEKSTDADGNNISYELSYCTNPQFKNCLSGGVISVESNKTTLQARINGFGSLFLFLGALGMVLFRNLRNRMNRLLLISIICISFTLTACSSLNSDDEQDTAKEKPEIVTITEPETGTNVNILEAKVTGLTPGSTYFWKVKATDSEGASIESRTFLFTVKAPWQ